MIIKANELFHYIKGKVGNLVFFPHPTRPGYMIGHVKGERKEPPKEGEVANQGKFSAKMTLANSLMARPEIATIYAALARLLGRNAFRLAVSDALKGPEVPELTLTGYTGRSGEKILIKASDNVDVVEVQVRILTLAGAVQEEGKAVRSVAHSDDWAYLAQSEVPAGETVVVEVTALDLPGNKTMKRFDHACGPRVGG